ncbi:hypothetical protein [Hymenobacter volaticus]|uniref:PAS domain-containing protein n=1 Tax=Hymenobacter volaticus TaxID=2932254 RepID=A0ABY4GD15_9BACT|nr:hypothetical protein [Hymenobacter volaticus]UOQ68675.1 hypothetical protein MUN86_23435 [Hymenobacter volaticus]
MSADPFFPYKKGPTHLTPEQIQGQQAERALAAAEARIADLEQQLAEASATAERHQKQLAALVENLPMGLQLVNTAGEVQLINSYFRNLFKLPSGATVVNEHPLSTLI